MKPGTTTTDVSPEQRATWFMKDMMLNLLYIFVVMVVIGVCLDVYPEYKRADKIVQSQFEAAMGAHQSSTCMYFRGELTEAEVSRWEKWAKAEGKTKCMDAEIVLSQNRVVLVARHLVYQYIPWSPGNASVVLRDVSLYLLTASPFIGYLLRVMMPYGVGKIAEFVAPV